MADPEDALEEEFRGQIVAHYSMLCGDCGREMPLDARKRRVGIDEARERGWVRTHDLGWVCPDCAPR